MKSRELNPARVRISALPFTAVWPWAGDLSLGFSCLLCKTELESLPGCVVHRPGIWWGAINIINQIGRLNSASSTHQLRDLGQVPWHL